MNEWMNERKEKCAALRPSEAFVLCASATDDVGVNTVRRLGS